MNRRVYREEDLNLNGSNSEYNKEWRINHNDSIHESNKPINAFLKLYL